jgi:hypothetical protein
MQADQLGKLRLVFDDQDEGLGFSTHGEGAKQGATLP